MKSILLIEDNPLLVELYKAAFENQKIKVFTAQDGQTGIDIAQKERPDIILLDLLMVGMNGFEVLKTLKNDQNTRNIKVVILSLVDDPASIDKAKGFGAEDYILKSSVTTDETVKRVMARF